MYIVVSVMAAKGVTDFTYLLNPPLSVGCSIDGFVKMVRKIFSDNTDFVIIKLGCQDTFGGLFNSITGRGSPHCFDLYRSRGKYNGLCEVIT